MGKEQQANDLESASTGLPAAVGLGVRGRGSTGSRGGRRRPRNGRGWRCDSHGRCRSPRRRGGREGAGSRCAGRQHIVPRCTGNRCTGGRCTRSSRQGRRARARSCTVRDGASSSRGPGAVAAAGTAESSAGFMRDLVEAMRRVAEETRQSSLSDLRTKAEERVRRPRGRCRATPRGAQGDAPRPTWPGSGSGPTPRRSASSRRPSSASSLAARSSTSSSPPRRRAPRRKPRPSATVSKPTSESSTPTTRS